MAKMRGMAKRQSRHIQPDYADVEASLAHLQLGVHASELHGSLTGFACAGGRIDPDEWIGQLELPPDSAATRDLVLQAMRDHVQTQLDSPEVGVELLLPRDSAPLASRADALVEWCRGFLGGFGLVGATQRSPLSGDAAEILSDFATIAASAFDCDSADDAQAFAEVREFVSTAIAWLQRDVRDGAHGTARALH